MEQWGSKGSRAPSRSSSMGHPMAWKPMPWAQEMDDNSLRSRWALPSGAGYVVRT